MDTSFGTGVHSRWRSLMSKLTIPFPYYDWNEHVERLPHFATEPLQNEVEVTGHPVIALYIATSDTDGVFHVYLEDLDEMGVAHYVTEGVLRGLHRKISDEERLHQDVESVPYHSYMRKDGQPMEPGKVELLAFDLLPVSYLFKKGHRIRFSISGADKDHFKIHNPGAEWKIFHSGEYVSFIGLPIISK